MADPSPWLTRWRVSRRWLGLVMGVLVLLGAVCASRDMVFTGGPGVDFVDADCYSRMTRVQLLIEHPGEVIRHHSFENYPFGTTPHTTAPLDYAIWALRGCLGALTGKEARDLAGAWISPLLGVVALVGLWCWAAQWSLADMALGIIVVAASPIVAHGFQLGRPDHQSLVLACMAWALAAEWAQWTRPSRGWGLASGAAWALGLWTSLYEPVILLALVLAVGLGWNRAALLRRERVPGVLLGAVILLLALWIEHWRIESVPGYGGGAGDEYFAAWSQQIGELNTLRPWSPALYAWTGLGLLAAPVLLWLNRGGERRLAQANLLLLIAVFALTCWQIRWGYFLPLVYALSLPWQSGALPVRWRPWVTTLLVLGLWPMAAEWRARLYPPPDRRDALAEQRDDTAQLREVAAVIARGVADEPVAPGSVATDDGVPDAGILAPWWQAPALAYWSGQPGVAGSSHESLPGTVDTARFYLSSDPRESAALLRRRRVRWVVAYEPERVLQTAGPLLGKARVSKGCMGVVLYREPDRAPRFLRLTLVNPYFKVYEVRSAFFPPPA